MKKLVAAKQFVVGHRFGLGNMDQYMEVIGHDGVGDDVNAAKLRHLPEHGDQDLASPRVEQGPALHAPGHAVINGIVIVGKNASSVSWHAKKR